MISVELLLRQTIRRSFAVLSFGEVIMDGITAAMTLKDWFNSFSNGGVSMRATWWRGFLFGMALTAVVGTALVRVAWFFPAPLFHP
jgi:hypothetical protein